MSDLDYDPSEEEEEYYEDYDEEQEEDEDSDNGNEIIDEESAIKQNSLYNDISEEELSDDDGGNKTDGGEVTKKTVNNTAEEVSKSALTARTTRRYKAPEKSTTRNMTTYEFTGAIVTRVNQLTHGAKPCVDITGMKDATEIALKEYYEGKLPLIIVRPYPSGKSSMHRMADLRANFRSNV